MPSKLCILLTLIFFFAGCKEASFSGKSGLNSYTFDTINAVDATFQLEIQRQTGEFGEALTRASLNEGALLEHNNDSSEELVAELSFQNSVVAHKFSNDQIIDFFEIPYLSNRPVFNVAATSLYTVIKNSLSPEDFGSLNVSLALWNELLQDYENFCQNCLEKSLSENIALVTNNQKFLQQTKDKIGASLNWLSKPTNEWKWVVLDTSPRVYIQRVVTLKEGETYTFSTKLFHISAPNKIFKATKWRHNLATGSTFEEIEAEETELYVSYDQDENISYEVSFERLADDNLPTFNLIMNANFENTNRSASLLDGVSLPNIVLAAGQGTSINLSQYFSDPDDPSYIPTMQLANPGELFKQEGLTNLSVFAPITPFNIGTHTVAFVIIDEEGLETEPFEITVTIQPNDPPEILHVYINGNPSVTYQSCDVNPSNCTVEFTEGMLGQSITVVSEDSNGDRTTVSLDKTSYTTLSSTFADDTNYVYGVVEPRSNANRKNFDYTKIPNFVFAPGGNQTSTTFDVIPSFYQTFNAPVEIDFEFQVLQSDLLVSDGLGGYTYVEIPLTPSEEDSFLIKVRVLNHDDPPITPPDSIINVNGFVENVNNSINIETYARDQGLLVDGAMNPSAVRMSVFNIVGECETWLSRSGDVVSGTPPHDSSGSCLLTGQIFDNSKGTHDENVYLTHKDLRTPRVTINLNIANDNRVPTVDSAAVTTLGSVDEKELIFIPMLDTTPGDSNNDGPFKDLDYDFTDPVNPLIDPREDLQFVCEISNAGANSYQECNSVGLEFIMTGLDQARVEPQHQLVKNTASQDYDLRVTMTDVSGSAVVKNYTLTVVNIAAPPIISFNEVTKSIHEGQIVTLDYTVLRFSDDPIDIYPFEIDLTCLACQSLITSDAVEPLTLPAFETQQTFTRSLTVAPTFSDGDGDGNKNSFIVQAKSRSTASSYASGAPPITPAVEATGQMILEVNHVNLAPTALNIEGNTSTSTYSFSGNRQVTSGVEFLNVSVIDPDPQDVIFATEVVNLTSQLISYNPVFKQISIDFSKCPIGGRTLIKDFSLRGIDSVGASVTRNVRVTLENVDTFSATCN